MAKQEQQELEGMRPKRIAALEAVVRDYVEAKDAQRQAKEDVDEAAERVAAALKQAGETAYGWKENGKLFVVALQDKETISLKVVEPKKKKKVVVSSEDLS